MLPLVHVSPGMRFVDAAGRVLLDWVRPAQGGPQGWNVRYRFHQPELEQVSRAGLARWPGVSLLTGSEVHALEQDADGLAGGRWAVAAALARSRRQHRAVVRPGAVRHLCAGHGRPAAVGDRGSCG